MALSDLHNLILQANNLRLKLLAIVGRNDSKKDNIIACLKENLWSLVDVESELISLKEELDKEQPESGIVLITEKVKEWFDNKPKNVVLINAEILYHDIFCKMSPIGAFKYRTRNKNTILFLEEEKLLGNRLTHGSAGKDGYYDQEIKDILTIDINSISDDFGEFSKINEDFPDYENNPNAIGHLLTFNTIKDVIDIDSDLDTEDKMKEIISSYEVSDSLQKQILSFFENLESPIHKAVKIIGNYGSGKSHLIAFLVSIISRPDLSEFIKNSQIKLKANYKRNYKIIQFELLSGNVDMSAWFYYKVREQLSAKYNIEIPKFGKDDFDHKKNLSDIMNLVKQNDPISCLLVVMDEVSDFIAQKETYLIRRDFGFLREVAQFCQSHDLMMVTSMQEDIYTNARFRDISTSEDRISERFQNITIHKEDIRRVISSRIIAKSETQKLELEKKLLPVAGKNKDVSTKIDQYIELFPLTPTLLNYFEEMPYFEKRGVIQFVQEEVKKILHKDFPCFLTFDYIYDVLENNPNKSNLEEIYNVVKAVEIVEDKISSILEEKYRRDALKITKGLAINHIRSNGKLGMTVEELTDNLILMPANQNFEAKDHVLLVVKKIKEATDGNYIKLNTDEISLTQYLKFDLDTTIDYEEKIEHKMTTIGEDSLESVLFEQIRESFSYQKYSNYSNVFDIETEWKTVKSFRHGYLVFALKGDTLPHLPRRDFAVVIVSPFRKEALPVISENQIEITLILDSSENTERFKRVCAIKKLIESNIAKSVMQNKLSETINGTRIGSVEITGTRYRLLKTFYNINKYTYNGEFLNLKSNVPCEPNNLLQLFENLIANFLDDKFSAKYPKHLVYSLQLSSDNIKDTLSKIISELCRADFTNLSQNSKTFLKSLSLLDFQDIPIYNDSEIAVEILDKITSQQNGMVDIIKDIHPHFSKEPFGLEPDMINLYLILLTVIGKILLKARGGDQTDISNIKEKIRSISQFETILYAQTYQNQSLDFAERLLTLLGLNGNKINIDKTRMEAFKEYKEKILEFKKTESGISALLNEIKEYSRVYLNLDEISAEIKNSQKIGWDELDIGNIAHFSKIESKKPDLQELRKSIEKQSSIYSALTEYKEYHKDIEYMIKAMGILDENPEMTTKQDAEFLQAYLNDVRKILADTVKFLNRSERNPISGKIKAFKKKYIYEIYHPFHENTIGNKTNWQELNNYTKCQTYQNLMLLQKLTPVNSAKLVKKIMNLESLQNLKCLNLSHDQLQISPICTSCYMPKPGVEYKAIKKTLDNIQDDLADLMDEFSQKAVQETIDYADNLNIADISGEQKEIIKRIISEKKFPENIDQTLINAINELFKEIEIVEVNREDFIKQLFPGEAMVSIEQIRKAFYEWEQETRKNRKEEEIRLKLV